MKVVLLVPCRNDSENFDAWSEHINKLDPKPDKTIFCENNSNDDTVTKIVNFQLPTRTNQIREHRNQNIRCNSTRARPSINESQTS